jgi:S-adenosylmethionine hydrolase
MSIVTLTSDYGTTDHYVASLKGRLLSLRPQLTIVDVSHNIHNFDIVQAAFVLKHAYLSFPQTAIHIALVHNSTGPQDLLCFERDGHYFIMPDNGLVTLLFEEITACNKIAMQASASWKESIAACVAELADGKKPEDLGDRTEEFTRKILLKPVVTTEYIRGVAVHIDHYDNIIFNIHRQLFESVRDARGFELYYKRHDPVREIHDNYFDVPIGEVVCIFNHAGYLKLGINMGRAASLLGIKVDDAVQIHFND